VPNVVDISTTVSGKLRDLEQRTLALERREQPTGAYQAGVDVYPDGEQKLGLWARTVNRAGITGYTDHHRAGTALSGFTWALGSGFGAEADAIWNRRGSFMTWTLGDNPHFLYDAIGTYDRRRFYARVRVGTAVEFGVRLDDGGTANYAEIVLDPNNSGAYVVDFRHKKAGAAETDTAGPTIPATQFSVVMLRYDNDRIYGRLIAEDGAEVGINGFDSGTVSWTPARVGYVARGNAGNRGTAVSDWFYNTFA